MVGVASAPTEPGGGFGVCLGRGSLYIPRDLCWSCLSLPAGRSLLKLACVPFRGSSVSQMKSSAKRAGILSAPARRATGLSPHTTWTWPHQREASSGASLQRFGGGVQARLLPALGTFKEAELWGGKDRSLRSGQRGQGLTPLPALLPLTLFRLLPLEGFQNTPAHDNEYPQYPPPALCGPHSGPLNW